MEIHPNDLSVAERYKLLIGCIVPRPIAFVSTMSPDGSSTNLAPFSFFNAIASHPMTLMFCPANNRDGSEKDTLRNAKPIGEGGTGQFVVNIASEAYEGKVAASGETLAYGESEFDFTGLTPAPSTLIRPPRVAESPVAFECETTHVIRLASDDPAGGNMVIGRVVYVHAHDELLNDRMHADPDVLRAIGRMGGIGYCRTRDRFDMPIGRAALSE